MSDLDLWMMVSVSYENDQGNEHRLLNAVRVLIAVWGNLEVDNGQSLMPTWDEMACEDRVVAQFQRAASQFVMCWNFYPETVFSTSHVLFPLKMVLSISHLYLPTASLATSFVDGVSGGYTNQGSAEGSIKDSRGSVIITYHGWTG